MKALSGTSWPVAGTDVDILERVGTLLELRSDLHHHVILVESLVHRGDLPLAKGVVERVVDGLRSDAQAAGRVAVDHQAGLQAVVLQIAVHILKLRDRLQFLLHHGRPGEQVLAGCRLASVYWNCALPARPPICTSCAACRKSVAPGTRASLGRSRLMT